MLMVYFYLNKADVADDLKRLRAGRKQMKRFARLNSASKKTFYEIHAFLMIYLYKLWLEEYEKTKPRMPNFNVIISAVKL